MDIQQTLFGTRRKSGLIFGIIGTFFMTLIMLIGMTTGISPIPEPIPVAIAETILGTAAQPALMIFGMVAHFAYGAVAGYILFAIAKDTKPILQGLGWGLLLWLIMHLLFLPFIGWGFFAGAVNVKVIPATLILHLIYGGILGYGLLQYHKKTAT